MEAIEQSAFVLHHRPYREHQQIVELLTEHDGKVSAVVYISKSSKSNKKALLQPFSPIKVILKGNNNLKYLSRVESQEKSYTLTRDFLYSGFYLNELLVRLLGELITCPALFYHYQQSLIALTNCQPIEPILRKFELDLLEELGVSLDFSPVFELDSAYFYYVAEHGFVAVTESLNLPQYKQQDLKAIAQQDLSTNSALLCNKQLMRQVFNHLLDGKPLNSRKLFIKT